LSFLYSIFYLFINYTTDNCHLASTQFNENNFKRFVPDEFTYLSITGRPSGGLEITAMAKDDSIM